MNQFLTYFFVGGMAAIVEWVTFFECTNIIRIPYYLSTVIAFVTGTFINLILGKKLAFKKSKKYVGKKMREVIDIFVVSGIGLLINLVLMKTFVDVLGLNTDLLMNLSKISSTGIVFIWNFLIRKLVVYKDTEERG